MGAMGNLIPELRIRTELLEAKGHEIQFDLADQCLPDIPMALRWRDPYALKKRNRLRCAAIGVITHRHFSEPYSCALIGFSQVAN